MFFLWNGVGFVGDSVVKLTLKIGRKSAAESNPQLPIHTNSLHHPLIYEKKDSYPSTVPPYTIAEEPPWKQL
jgi:hypothetical protein